MVPSPSHPDPDIDDILALASTEGPKVRTQRGYKEDFEEYFDLWLENTEISPGPSCGVTATDLYRHFMEFLAINSLEIPPVGYRAWGKALKKRGFIQGRAYVNKRDSRPYLLNRNAVTYFRNWLAKNPSPPKHQGPFAGSFDRRAPK